MHVGMTLTSSSLSAHSYFAFVNGRPRAKGTTTTTYSTVTAWYLGNTGGGGSALQAYMRDVRFWSRTLANNEMVQEYAAPVPVHKNALIGWWPMDLDLTYDHSGQNRVMSVAAGAPALVGLGGIRFAQRRRRLFV